MVSAQLNSPKKNQNWLNTPKKRRLKSNFEFTLSSDNSREKKATKRHGEFITQVNTPVFAVTVHSMHVIRQTPVTQIIYSNNTSQKMMSSCQVRTIFKRHQVNCICNMCVRVFSSAHTFSNRHNKSSYFWVGSDQYAETNNESNLFA